MPFTPFHLGPGLFAKSAAPRHFSWAAFGAAQVVIDLETLYFLRHRTYPVHRFLHTLPGAFAAGLFTAAALLLAREALGKSLRGKFGRTDYRLASEGSTWGILAGALLGGLSHPLLDGLMHADVRPFAPFSQANPLLGLVSLGGLHVTCFFLAVVGAVVLWTRTAAAGGGSSR